MSFILNLFYFILGRANLALTAQKQYLQTQILQLAKLKEKISATEKKLSALDDESEKVERELDKVQEKYMKFKEIRENYRVL